MLSVWPCVAMGSQHNEGENTMKRIVLLTTVAFIMTSCSKRSPQPYSLDAFLKDRNAAMSFLQKSFAVMPEGATLTKLSAKSRAFDANFPGDDHIRGVVRRQRWTSHSHYQFSMDLSEAMLSHQDQGNSATMAATELLDHFFAGLNGLGFRNSGSPNALLSDSVQYSSNSWFKEGSNNISIVGSVFVSVKDRTALVVVNISEVY